jgi:hypothetical protein
LFCLATTVQVLIVAQPLEHNMQPLFSFFFSAQVNPG